MGAAFLNRIARFLIDPRDERPAAQIFEVVGTDEGVFGCIGLMACDDLCPMEIPLQGQLAFVRRKMARAASDAGNRRTAVDCLLPRRPWLQVKAHFPPNCFPSPDYSVISIASHTSGNCR